MFMRTLGLRIGLGLGLGLGLRVKHRVSVWVLRSNVNRGRQEYLFSSMCFYILHPNSTCALLTTTPFPHTHNFGQKLVCLV